MADDALEFATDDKDFHTKMNRKTKIVGRGRQINSLVTTYAGQEAYCTETENGFTIDKRYLRDATNATWTGKQTGSEVTESSTTIGADGLDHTLAANLRWYNSFTLPSTEKFYLITGIEWKVASQNGNVLAGIELRDGGTDNTVLVGVSQEVAMAANGTTQRVSLVACNPVRGGSTVQVWISGSSGLGQIRGENSGTGSYTKTIVYSAAPALLDTSTITGQATRLFYKIYYVGVLY